VKTALDAINTIVVTDDALVVEMLARKRFSDQPKLVAIVTPLDATAANTRTKTTLQAELMREND
jgi:hypothetical protein